MDAKFQIDVIGPATHPACRELTRVFGGWGGSGRRASVAEYCPQRARPADDGVIVVIGQQRLNEAECDALLKLPGQLWQRGPFLPLIVVGPASEAARSWEAGAAQFCSWPAAPQQLIARIRQTLERSRQLRRLLAPVHHRDRHLRQLSAREREVAERLADGWWIKRIAAHLGTSPATVRNQRARVIEKLEATSELEAVLLIQGARWLQALRP